MKADFPGPEDKSLQGGRGTVSYTACDLKKRAEEQHNSLEVQAVQPNSLFVVFCTQFFPDIFIHDIFTSPISAVSDLIVLAEYDLRDVYALLVNLV